MLSVVDDASENQLSETTNPGGDENQMVVHKPGRSRAAVDPEKAVEKAAKVGLSISSKLMADYLPHSFKEKERNEKKAAKAEKERKDKQSQEKARSIMASFFGKPKASSTTSSKGPTPSTSNTLSDFDRVFRPFALKKDAELAPINWIQDAKRRKRNADADVIVIDDDDTGDHDVEMSEREPSPDSNTRGTIFFLAKVITVD